MNEHEWMGNAKATTSKRTRRGRRKKTRMSRVEKNVDIVKMNESIELTSNHDMMIISLRYDYYYQVERDIGTHPLLSGGNLFTPSQTTHIVITASKIDEDMALYEQGPKVGPRFHSVVSK